MSKNKKGNDLIDYFKMFEKKWWEEGNKEEISLHILHEVGGEIFGVNAATLEKQNINIDLNDSSTSNNIGNDDNKRSSNNNDINSKNSETVPTLSVLFRSIAELEVYNYKTLDDIRTFSQMPFALETEYKDALKTMWSQHVAEDGTMGEKGMSKLLKWLLKKEQQDEETMLKGIGIAKDRIKLGLEKACEREIKNAKSRSSNDAYIEKQFTDQKNKILETLDASYKMYKNEMDGKYKKMQHEIYNYFRSNINIYSQEMLYHISKVAALDYQIAGPDKSIAYNDNVSKQELFINFPQFILGFLQSLDIVFTGSRFMVDQGYLFPSLFDFSQFLADNKKKSKQKKYVNKFF